MASNAPRPPGPKGFPLLGVATKISPSKVLQFIEASQREYGDVFRLPLPGGRSMVIVCSPEGIEQVLSTNRENYVKGAAYDGVRDLVGASLLTLEGEHHTLRRRITQPAFHKRSLVKLAQTMAEATSKWFDRLQARIPDGGVLDIHREMTHVTLEIVLECLFGRGAFERTNISYETMTECLEVLSSAVNGLPIPRWVPTPSNLKLKRVLKALNTDVYEVIAAGREALARGEEDGSLLQMLLQSVDEETGEALDDDAIRDEVITLFIAGHETTALTMTWFFDFTSDAPEVVAAIREEVAEVLGDRPAEFGDLMKMVTIRRVVDEVLRLRPPAPWIGRNPVTEDTIGGFTVLPTDMITTSFWAAHRHKDHWRDPDRFDPDRFLPERNKDRHKYAFVPFSMGPRICIGKSFSYIEAAAIVAELVRRCDWTRAGGGRPDPWAVATVRPSTPVMIDLAWR